MKYLNKQEDRDAGSRRSNQVALNPYFVEGVAMTSGELARARAGDGPQ
jgi:hypothetical protein